ncbi:DAK2 domain-containing protein [Mycolicibacterium houstonense]|uniref:DAK2 domain-containing protein n=1 Tax=Mycolicibacterium houstonense TaxID=146021 RepID=UPI00093B289C|nr:DAK2 domain-containing protein [Mycolicibacterium houstonense]
MSSRQLDAPALRAWAHAAVDDLIPHTDEINRLNVFPVADADTGTNMLFTMRSAWAHVDTEPAGSDIAAVAGALAAGALQGARGNSGVILSQILGCTAAIGWGIDVVPVPAGSMVQGLAALAVHDEGRQAVDDGYTMARAAAAARHGTVRIATEEALTWAGSCKPGDGLGIAGDEVLIVGPDLTSAAAGLIDLLMVAGGELITVLTGAGVDGAVGKALQDHVHREHLGAELVTYHTGHRGDALLIGVE